MYTITIMIATKNIKEKRRAIYKLYEHESNLFQTTDSMNKWVTVRSLAIISNSKKKMP